MADKTENFAPAYEEIPRKGGIMANHVLLRTAAANIGSYGTAFFVAPRPLEVLTACMVHSAPATDVAAVTVNLEILNSGEAGGTGDEVLVTPYDLKGTANVPVLYSGTDLTETRTLAAGDMLALKLDGDPTDARDFVAVIYYKFANRGDFF